MTLEQQKGGHVLSKATIARITGILFLVVVPVFIVTVVTDSGVDTRVDFFRADLRDVADSETQSFVSAGFGFLMSGLFVATGAGMYLTFRPYERFLSLLGAFAFLAAGVSFMAGMVGRLTLTQLAREFGGTSGIEADQIVPAARAVALASEWSFLAGLGFFGLGLLALGILIIWRRPLPRWLGWMAAGCGILIIVGMPTFFISVAGSLIGFVWLLITGGLLVWRGTNDAGLTAS